MPWPKAKSFCSVNCILHPSTFPASMQPKHNSAVPLCALICDLMPAFTALCRDMDLILGHHIGQHGKEGSVIIIMSAYHMQCRFSSERFKNKPDAVYLAGRKESSIDCSSSTSSKLLVHNATCQRREHMLLLGQQLCRWNAVLLNYGSQLCVQFCS